MKIARTVALCVCVLTFQAAAFATGSSMRIPDAALEPVDYSDLDGWYEDDQAAAFAAFRKSCEAILRRRDAKTSVPALKIHLRAACVRAMRKNESVGRDAARDFFERNFRPLRIHRLGESEGFLTGYYEPEIEGSRSPGDGFTVPLYRTPKDLVVRRMSTRHASRQAGAAASPALRFGKRKGGRIVPYHDRAAIEDGALEGRGLEICWVRDEVEAFFIHIQGSARIRLADGSLLRINYDAQNGHPYFPIGRELIDRGIVPREEMSMDKIRTFIAEHEEEGRALMRMNPSYIFFREVDELGPDDEPIGAQGVSLTRDRSIAVDRNLHVYGTPFWIEAELPLEGVNSETRFRRLMLAQDTGGAIVGPARADIYLGAGVDAGTVAGRIRHLGHFYMLVPRAADPVRTAAVPLPPKRMAAVPTPPKRMEP